MSAFGQAADENLRSSAGAPGSSAEGSGDISGVRSFAKGNGGTAESAAGQAGTKDPWQFLRSLNELIQFGGAVFKIGARTFMGFVHQSAEAGAIAALE